MSKQVYKSQIYLGKCTVYVSSTNFQNIKLIEFNILSIHVYYGNMKYFRDEKALDYFISRR